jgi:hypothetical protein
MTRTLQGDNARAGLAARASHKPAQKFPHRQGEPLLGSPLPALSFGLGNGVAHGHRLQQHLFGGDKGVARVIG